MTTRMVPTHTITLYVAGDLAAACAVVRKYCYESGACFTVTRTEFIYTGGEESDITIKLVNYPRFPSAPAEQWLRCEELAELILPALNQRTCLLVGTTETRWVVREPPGAS